MQCLFLGFSWVSTGPSNIRVYQSAGDEGMRNLRSSEAGAKPQCQAEEGDAGEGLEESIQAGSKVGSTAAVSQEESWTQRLQILDIIVVYSHVFILDVAFFIEPIMTDNWTQMDPFGPMCRLVIYSKFTNHRQTRSISH